MKDPCIRQILKEKTLLHFIHDNDSKVVEELTLPVAKARIDIAVLNGHFHGFEIKSASDTLKRLPSQIEAYTKIFDFLTIVTEPKYVKKVCDITPDWIGIIVCDETNGKKSVKQFRKAKHNNSKEGFYIAKLLWREELFDVLTDNNIKFRKKDRNWILCEELSSNLTVKKLSNIVREKIKNRPDWKKLQ